MPVFKLSMKIIRKNLPIMLIYIIIFLAISMLFATQSTDQQHTSYSNTKINMAFISEDDSLLIEGFKEKLSEYANFVHVEDEKDKLQDALFFRSIEYILRVPKGFTENFMEGDASMQLVKTIVPASISSAYIDITVNKYFNTARLYVDGVAHISQEHLVENLKRDLSYQLPIEFQDKELAENNHVFAMNYFNYLAYSMFAVLVLGISAIMIVLNDMDRKKRNACAPLSILRMNLEFLLAHLFFTIASWVIMMSFYFLLDYKNANYTNTLYFMMNAFIFALCASSISYLIGSLVKNQNALSAISNVVTLGPCFISGIFVPQELLGATVLRIASFTPTYWFAKANGIISNLTEFDMSNIKPVLTAMLIQAGFAIAFLSIALLLNKKRSMSY